MVDEKDTWNEWRKHVLISIDNLQKANVKLSEDHQKLAIEMAVIKAKVAIYAVIGGSAATLAMNFLIKNMSG